MMNPTKSQEPQLFGPHSSLLNFSCEGLSWEAAVPPVSKKDLDDLVVEEASSSFVPEKTTSKAPVTPKTPKKSKMIKKMKEKEIPDDLLSPKSRNGGGSSRRKISRSTPTPPELKLDLETQQREESDAHKERIIKKALASQKGDMTPLKMSTSQALDNLNLRFAANHCMHAPTGVIIVALNEDEMTHTTDISKLTLPPELDYSRQQSPFLNLSDIAGDHPSLPPSRMKTTQQQLQQLRKKENQPHQLPVRIQEEQQQERPSEEEDRDTSPKPPGRNSSFMRTAPGKTSSFSQMASNLVGKGAAFMHTAAKKVETSLLSVTSWDSKEGAGTPQVADESEKMTRRSSWSRSKSRERTERSRSRSGRRTRTRGPSSNGEDEKEEKPATTPRRATKSLGLKLAAESTADADTTTKLTASSQSLPVTIMSPLSTVKQMAGYHLEGAKQTSLRSLNTYPQPRSSKAVLTSPRKPAESSKKLSRTSGGKSQSSRTLGSSSALEESKKVSRSSRTLGSVLERESKKLSRSSRTLGSSSALEESKKVSKSCRTLGSVLERESKRLSRSSRTLGSALDEYDAAASSPKPKSTKSLAFRSGEKSRSSRMLLEREKYDTPKQKSSRSLVSSRSTEYEGSIDVSKPKASKMLSPTKQSSRKVSKSSESLKSLASNKSSEKSSSLKTTSETSSEPTSPDPALGDDKALLTFEPKTTPVLVIRKTQTASPKQDEPDTSTKSTRRRSSSGTRRPKKDKEEADPKKNAPSSSGGRGWGAALKGAINKTKNRITKGGGTGSGPNSHQLSSNHDGTEAGSTEHSSTHSGSKTTTTMNFDEDRSDAKSQRSETPDTESQSKIRYQPITASPKKSPITAPPPSPPPEDDLEETSEHNGQGPASTALTTCTSTSMAREEDEETVDIQIFDENCSKAVEVEGEGKGSLQILHGILSDIEDCDENSERRERSDYSGEEYGMALKGGAPIDEEDEMSEMISAEGASPARPSPRRKIKFMPTPSSDGDAYSDILSTADKSMPPLTDFSMEDFSMGPPEKTVPMNDSTFSGLKKGMDKPAPKKEFMSPVGKSRVKKSPDNKIPAPVSKSWRALRGSVDFIRETKERARVTRNQRRTIVEDNPRDDDDIDSTSSPFIGDIHLPTALAQLGSAGIVQPHIEVVDGKTRLVFELTSSAESSSMDLVLQKLARALSARV